jgi:hypothetical protein
VANELSLEDSITQNNFMFDMSLYLRMAKKVGEEDLFYERFFEIWFERWPVNPTNEEDVEKYKEIVKEVCVRKLELEPPDNFLY